MYSVKESMCCAFHGLLISMVLAIIVSFSPVGHAQQVLPISGSTATLQVPLYKSRIVQVRRPVMRISVGNPAVADILSLEARQVYVLGQSLGTTNVVLWDENDKVIATIDVEVTHDLDTLKRKLHELLPHENIQVHSSSGVIVLGGEISSAAKIDAAMKLAASFSPKEKEEEEEKVLNLMQVGGAQQVMLEVKVAEVNRTILKRLKINFNVINAGNQLKIGAVSGGAAFPDALFGVLEERIPIFSNSNPIGPVIDEFNPSTLSIEDKGFFGTFLSDDVLFNVVIDAAKDKGLAKILAEPTLTTLTGQEARFLSGGEFPIPVPGEDGRVTIEFKEFGIALRFLPVVLDSGRISLKVNVSVSELSAANSIALGVAGTETTFAVPAITTRGATATLELADGQAMAIAGLISDSLRENVNKFPGLGDIPILGLLFRSQEFRKEQTELVIFVTPHFARPNTPELVRLPTDNFVEPNDVEFYLMGRLEGELPVRPTPAAHTPSSEVFQKGGAEGAFGHDL